MLGLFRTAPFGVDIGSGSVKVIGLKSKKISLASFIDTPLSVKEDESLFTNTLRNFFNDLGIIGKEAVVHIPGIFSFIRTVSLPLMPKSELKEAVKWEIKRQLPYPPEEAVYDYVAKEVSDGISVTFASAERRTVQQYIFPVKEAGLNIVAVDVNPLCLLRALPLQIQTSGNTIVLDIGARNMEIDIIKSGSLKLTRTVEIGGEHIKNYLQNEGFLDQEAENLMMNGPSDRMKNILDQFLKEVFRSIDYYKATFKEKTFSEVVLTGGVAINYAIKSYFSQSFDIPVNVPNPFDAFAMRDEALRPFGPRFSVAIGLARRAS